MRAPDFIRDRAKDLRRTMTQPERTLWAMLRRNPAGLHFRRQHPIGPFILDFYCAAARLGVEVDGPAHDDQADRDQRRTAWLAKEGIRVIRFTALDVEQHPAMVVAAIAQAAPPPPPDGGPPPARAGEDIQSTAIAVGTVWLWRPQARLRLGCESL